MIFAAHNLSLSVLKKVVVCLITFSIFSLSLTACVGQRFNISSSDSSQSSALKFDMSKFSSDVQFSFGVFPHGNDLMYLPESGTLGTLKAASIMFVFYDGYGDCIGSYDVEFNASNHNFREKVKGLDAVASGKAYIYSYVLEDGTVWGDRNATSEEIVSYGKAFPVAIN